MEALLEKIKAEARASWPGETGERHAQTIEAFLRKTLASYAKTFGVAEEDILTAFEGRRRYNVVNYYQEANFPDLSAVVVLDNPEEFKRLYPSGRFVCPSCGAESANPFWCTSGAMIGEGKARRTCDWKAHGLFRTMGKGMRLTFREGFLDHPKIEEIFMPVEAAACAAQAVAA